MIIVFLLLSIVIWLMAAALFEMGYRAIKNQARIQKVQACRIWWLALGVVSCLSGTPACLLNLPLIVLTGMSHIDLAGRGEDVVRLKAICGNIPEALRNAVRRIRNDYI